jgi:uncharacterized protein (DUF849 family)
MNREVFITCPVTGSGNTQDRSPQVPRTPKEIADSAIDAAKAGAAIVHCHVRDPETGKHSRRVELYREVTERIRDADTDVVINLTAGMGGDLILGPADAPLPLNEDGTDMASAEERVEHVAECRPEICTLDCGTMNFAEADYVMTNTPGMLRAMGQMMTAPVVREAARARGSAQATFTRAAVYGYPMGRTGRPAHIYGNGCQRSGRLDLFCVLAWQERNAVCCGGDTGWRQCARRARG